MKKIKIFVSSVQNEFSYERKMLYEYFLADPLLGRFFELFLFEQLPAIDQKVDTVYLKEVQRCDIYLGILGNDYGSEDKEGISPTEREFDFATKHNKTRLIFISNSENRNPKEIKFNKKAQSVLVRKSFSAIGELKSSAYAAMVKYLMEKEVIRTAPFDASIDGKASIKDIDSEKIRQFIRLAKSKRGFVLEESVEPETLLTHLNLMDGDRVKNGAVLLFGKTPQRFFISSEIRCAYFQGVEVEKPIQSYKVFKGDVFELVNHAIEFVLNKLDYKVETRKEHVQIPGSYEIPKEIIAEAIVNAVVHRDYTSNASVQLMMFRDRIEIWNPGSLPLGWTTEKLKKLHNSIPANPLLAEPMYLTAFIERLGTGTTDMIKLAKNANLPEPKFIQEDMFRTIIYRQVTPQVTPQDTPQVTPQVIKLIMLISGEMSREEIQKELHLSDKRNYINNYQNPAIKKGYLEMTIPHKPKSKNQKYRLTQKGLALKSSEKSR